MTRRCAASLSVAMLAITAASASAQPRYRSVTLVSDGTIPAFHTDRNLVEPWGMAFTPSGVFWVANKETGLASLYTGAGLPNPLAVRIPNAAGTLGAGTPMGVVYYGGQNFMVTNGTVSGPARIIFATEDGAIAAWSPKVSLDGAFVVSTITDEPVSYTGLAIARDTPAGDVIYATDFANGIVRVFDGDFAPITLAGSFDDPGIPAGYSPFGIQTIGGTVYVTYARQNANNDVVPGAHLGFVSAFNRSGQFIRRVASSGKLNAPWGVAMAPSNFGAFSNALLIGNTGDGRITAYNPVSGELMGQLRNRNNLFLSIEGLHGIAFRGDVNNNTPNTLYYTSSPGNGAHGTYGAVIPILSLP